MVTNCQLINEYILNIEARLLPHEVAQVPLVEINQGIYCASCNIFSAISIDVCA